MGASASCGILIVINANNTASVYSDPSVGPYDGYDDTLVGVQNNSSQAIPALSISSTQPSFAFSGDGICETSMVSGPHPAGCPFGPTGYEGPGISYTVPGGLSASACGFGYSGPWVCANDSQASSGTVTFSRAVAPGGSAYFGLQEPLTAADLNVSPPGPTPSAGPTLRTITTTDASPACPGPPTAVTAFAPTASSVWLFFILDGVRQSDVVTAAWVNPQGSQYKLYTGWGPNTGSYCYWDHIDIADHPPGSMPGTWTIQIFLNQNLLTTVQFTITGPAVSRSWIG